MNDQTFAEEIKAVLEQELLPSLGRPAIPANGDIPETPAAPCHVTVGQTADPGERPLVVLAGGKYQQYSNGFRKGKFRVTLYSHFGDENANPLPPKEFTHQGRFERLFQWFLGEPNGEEDPKQLLRFLVTLRGKVEMFDYGLDADLGVDSGVEGQELVTTLHLNVAFRHLTV